MRGYNSTTPDHIKKAIYLTMTLENHSQPTAPLLITSMTWHDVIIGKTWLRRHGVSIDTIRERILFTPNHCDHPGGPKKWLQQDCAGYEPPAEQKKILTKPTKVDTERIKTESTQNEQNRPETDSTETTSNQGQDDEKVTPQGVNKKKNKEKKKKTISSELTEPPISVAQIGAVPFVRLARKPAHELFAVGDFNFWL